MQAVTGVFPSRAKAEHAVERLIFVGVRMDKVALLVPGKIDRELKTVPIDAAEQPGVGKAIGAVIGAAAGLSGGSLLLAAVIPGVGPVTANRTVGRGGARNGGSWPRCRRWRKA
jgi:hypothetical protein